MEHNNLQNLLDFIDPCACDYTQWCCVGMALKSEGYGWEIWDDWSQRDSARYKAGECERKWRTFNGAENPVTGGTIVKMAIDGGYTPERRSTREYRALDWDDEIGEDYVVTSKQEAQEIPVLDPENWDPVQEITRYLRALFQADDFVGYVTESWQAESGKYLPKNGGCCDRTAGRLLQLLERYRDDITKVFGDTDPNCGAWIRFNPMDGKGNRDENVIAYRYALVESDNLSVERQNGILRELQLPIAALVHSGNKSLHAIVRVDADNLAQYRERVAFLYNVCDKNGLKVDKQNKNPSRLSRMPGVVRGNKKQYLVATNIGLPTWAEWKEYIDSVNDDLPDFETLGEVWENMPELAPPLIDGVLRQGHKMLIAGPSKAGKSYALIEMCIAIAEGTTWFGWPCAQGRVLYVNLELDRASCLHRFRDVYSAMHLLPHHLDCISIWNLRGETEPLDKLVPKLIRRAKKERYIAVVIDPIYKVITGDENAAAEMAHFCNQFDKICAELECACIYCHHHSKGAQGGKKSMDRASGSGVFARDPDALLDLLELEPTEEILFQEKQRLIRDNCIETLRAFAPDALQNADSDDLESHTGALQLCQESLPPDIYEGLKRRNEGAEAQVKKWTAWRMEGTLREFPRFEPKNFWFRHPVHVPDYGDGLKNIKAEAEMTPRELGNKRGHKVQAEKAKYDRGEGLMSVFHACNVGGSVSLSEMAEYLGVTEKTVRNRVNASKSLRVINGKVCEV